MTHFESSSQTPLTRPKAWPCHLASYHLRWDAPVSHQPSCNDLFFLLLLFFCFHPYFFTTSPVIFWLTSLTSLISEVDSLDFKLACTTHKRHFKNSRQRLNGVILHLFFYCDYLWLQSYLTIFDYLLQLSVAA